MEKLLEQAKKSASSVEVYYVEQDTNEVEFEFDKLHSVEEKHIKGVGLRVIKDGKIGFSSSTDLLDFRGLVDNAIASAKFGQNAEFELPATNESTNVKTTSKEIEQFGVESAIEIGKEAIELIKERNPDVKCEAGFSKDVSKTRILNSNGFDEEYKQTVFSYSLGGILVLGESFIQTYEGNSSCELKLRTNEFVNKILEKLELAKKVAAVPTKKTKVIFTSEAMISLLQAVLLGINGKSVQKKVSPLTQRIGEKIFDERISIIDDGTLDFSVGTAPFDDEGTRTRRTPLFENGVLKSFIFDLQTAGIMHQSPTGNGARSFATLPSPGMTNIVISHGDWEVEDMIKDVQEGIIVHHVIGGGQSNLLAGDFSLNIGLGYKIENGELVGRVKDTMVAGNVYEVFNNIIGLGKEVKQVYGSIWTPAFYFNELSVASK